MGKKKKSKPIVQATGKGRPKHLAWGILALILILAVLLRVHLLPVPLERDEGEYAYAGQLILQGVLPYSEVYNMKMPGTYAAYALILGIFGQTQTGIHVGLMLINMATIVLIFLLGKRLWGTAAGLAAGAAFAVLSVGQPVQGVFANAEHFVVLAGLGGVLLLLLAADTGKRQWLFGSGLLLGLSFLMKQHGFLFFVFACFYLVYREWRGRPFEGRNLFLKGVFLVSGFLLPFGLTCLIFFAAGVFDKFWFWTFTYAGEYASLTSSSEGLAKLQRNLFAIVEASPLIWLLAVAGLAASFWDKRVKERSPFLWSFIFFSFLAVFPGLYFRPHYFILLLPAVALAAGAATGSLAGGLLPATNSPIRRALPVMVVLIALGQSIYQQRVFLFQAAPAVASRMTYLFHPFPEAPQIAEYIRKNTSQTDRIVVIGSEPEIYFYARRRAATGYIYTYPLMENQPFALNMQKEMIREIESSAPKFMVFVNMPASWLASSQSHQLILRWYEQYQREHYDRVGIVDITNPWETSYLWDEKSRGYSPQSRLWISVYKRRS